MLGEEDDEEEEMRLQKRRDCKRNDEGAYGYLGHYGKGGPKR